MIDIYSSGPEKKFQGFVIEGSFVCASCNEVCDEAVYEPQENTMTWMCSQNHISSGSGLGS